MYDVMAIGNALVDHEYLLSDAALEETDLTKGNMTLAGLEEQQQLLAYFKLAEIAPSKQAGGGSAAKAAAFLTDKSSSKRCNNLS